MKRMFIVVAVCLLLCCLVAPAGAARLVWDPSTGTVNGYRIYQDDMATPAAETNPDVTEWVLPDMVIGKEYLLGVSAYNQAGESAKAMVRFTYQENIEINLPLQPVNISINFDPQ